MIEAHRSQSKPDELPPEDEGKLPPDDRASAEDDDKDAVVELAEQVGRRLRSSGGRPTDPDWTLSRQVPFSSSTWEALQRLSEDVSIHGRKVGPAAIAALLVESELGELDEIIRQKAERRGT